MGASGALFGHPYEWENGGTVSWVRVYYTEAQFRALTKRPIHDLQVLGGRFRLWPRWVYRWASTAPRAGGTAEPSLSDGTQGNDGLPDAGTVSFLPNIASTSNTVNTGSPGAADVPGGNFGNTPINEGSWSGQRGNSTWNSTSEPLIAVCCKPLLQLGRSKYLRRAPDASPP